MTCGKFICFVSVKHVFIGLRKRKQKGEKFDHVKSFWGILDNNFSDRKISF